MQKVSAKDCGRFQLLSPFVLNCCLQLRDQRQVVEETVDDIVQGYHSGFNKAIHNYSQILRLFSDAKSQVRLASPPLPWSRALLHNK